MTSFYLIIKSDGYLQALSKEIIMGYEKFMGKFLFFLISPHLFVKHALRSIVFAHEP